MHIHLGFLVLEFPLCQPSPSFSTFSCLRRFVSQGPFSKNIYCNAIFFYFHKEVELTHPRMLHVPLPAEQQMTLAITHLTVDIIGCMIGMYMREFKLGSSIMDLKISKFFRYGSKLGPAPTDKSDITNLKEFQNGAFCNMNMFHRCEMMSHFFFLFIGSCQLYICSRAFFVEIIALL